MKVRDLMPIVFDTYVRVFELDSSLFKSNIWHGYPCLDDSWLKFGTRDIAEIKAVYEESNTSAELFITIE